MKPALKIPLFILLAIAVIGGAIYAYTQGTTPTLEERYRLQAVEQGELIQTVSANGTLNPVVLVNVGTQVSGTVTKLYVDFNDKVEKGQPLVVVHANSQEKLAQAMAYVEKAFEISAQPVAAPKPIVARITG